MSCDDDPRCPHCGWRGGPDFERVVDLSKIPVPSIGGTGAIRLASDYAPLVSVKLVCPRCGGPYPEIPPPKL